MLWTKLDDENIYKALISLRSSGTRDYHNLNATYLTANLLLISLISILLFMGGDPAQSFNAMILILSLLGFFLCFQMVFAQNRMRYINKLYEERLRKIEDENKWSHRIYVDIYNLVYEEERLSFKKFCSNYTSDSGYRSEIYKERFIGFTNFWFGGRMKTFPWVFILLYLLAFIYQFFF